jgi:hypothetical protein
MGDISLPLTVLWLSWLVIVSVAMIRLPRALSAWRDRKGDMSMYSQVSQQDSMEEAKVEDRESEMFMVGE